MSVSQKCQYAVRALLELAKKPSRDPMRSGEIAARQGIPPRFLENILNELKTAGLVEARRGVQGGFLLACNPAELTVGRVIRLIDGSLDPVRPSKDPGQHNGHGHGDDRGSLNGLWEEAKVAVESVYDHATFADLARKEIELERSRTAEYSI